MTSSLRWARTDRALGAAPVAPSAADHRVAPRTARLPRSGASFEARSRHLLPGRNVPAPCQGRQRTGRATSEACETKPPPERLRVPFNRTAKRGNGRRSRTSAPPDNQQQPAATSRSTAPASSRKSVLTGSLNRVRASWLYAIAFPSTNPVHSGSTPSKAFSPGSELDHGTRSLLGEKLERAEFADHRRHLAYYPEHLRYGVA